MSEDREVLVFRGSLMDGLRTPDGEITDLVEGCGLQPLNDQEYDRLWGETSDNHIIENCVYAYVEVTGEIDEIPGQSDEFFDVTTFDVEKLKQEVQESILSIIEDHQEGK